MSAANSLLFFLAAIPLLWAAASWRNSTRKLALLLKAFSLSAIFLALAEPKITLPRRSTGAVVLVDASSSIATANLEQTAAAVDEIQREKGSNWLSVIPFAARPRSFDRAKSLNEIRAARTGADGWAAATDLEAALDAGMGAIPAGFLPKIVLFSDGNENQGSAARAVAQLQAARVPVDAVPLTASASKAIRIDSISFPRTAYTGEPISVDLTLVSPSAVRATAELFADNQSIGSQPLELQAGTNIARITTRIKSTGAVTVNGRIRAGGFGDAAFDSALQLRKAKLLYLSEDPPSADANLLNAIGEASVSVSRDWAEFEREQASFALVILNNLDLNRFSDERKTRLQSYVKNGGGLLLIGGERQVYKEDKKLDALDRALPAKLAPPENPKGICVALIIDKSSSMEGRKIELARLSAIGVVDHLKPIDQIGVLMFDNSFQWAVPMRRAEDKPLIERLVSGITPDGGTQIAPALAEAYRRVLPSHAGFKHIVLLTDGISEEGDSVELAKEASEHEVTISTVGLGQDVNRSYLEKVAAVSGGRSYFLNEPVGLEQILLKDVQTFSGSTSVEKALTPIVETKADVIEGVSFDTAPALKGYARYVADPAAETILRIDAIKRDPLYVRWQYGLGRSAVFSSDAKSRWAEEWVTWPGFDRFWTNVVRDLLAHTERSEATAEYNAATEDLLVGYRLANQAPEPTAIPDIFVLGPDRFQKPIAVGRVAPRLYEGRLHLGSATGLFRIRPVTESADFPEIGLQRSLTELRETAPNERLLRQIAEATNGRYDPPLNSIFDSGGRSLETKWNLWPLCIAIAILLTIAELFMRKWSGLRERFRARSVTIS